MRVPEQYCLNCGELTDALSQVAKPGDPRHSERPNENEHWFTVCINCGHLMAVTPDLTLRELTDAELLGMAGDQRLVAINRARQCPICDGIGHHKWNCTLVRGR
jgi:hypothetical protein